MRGSKLILKVLAVFGVLAIADKSTATTSCPYANSDKLELYPASKSKRSSESFRFEVRPAVSGSNLDLLLKEYLPKYNTNSDSSPSSWLDLSGSSQPVRCGIPPLNCLNDTINLHYRSIDGSCNSLLYPEFGIAVSRYRRLLPPKYGKPVQALPNARLISLSLYGEHTRNDNFRTMAAMQWGQYVAHDISQLTTKGAPKDCCAEPHHHRCQPIALPRGGPIAYNTGKTCLHFANSVSDADAICPKDRAPYPEKLTLSTAYLDLSSVYGNSLHQSRRVRLFKGGRLRTSYINGQHWLPVSQNFEGECGSRNECYSMPDRRNRFSPTIALLQTLLVREHNRLVENLALLNPHYSDERLYQEARKISIAQFQKITFNDWLPLYLGQVFWHFRLVAPNRSSNQTLRLSDYFERSETIRLLDSSDNFDALLRGLATQLHKRSDGNIDPEIKHFFNRKDFEEYGSDLKSLDIQRARDFGLASYNDVREFCGLRRAVDWPDFTAEIPREKIALLKKLYATPDDVELSVGGSLEFHVPEALFGPTLLCIIGKQFLNTRRGDRFFFERDHTGGFSRKIFHAAQLAEIRKASLASLFCNNANYLRDIQPNVFVFPNV
ncbi:GL22991 [Drosophila persimilis]|uniref:GL22991 n=1 Tax=Drosophila persimilis TaxID=7234 RepID=B4G4K7_DROPE|nr:GL22991 [Drosophila persimilis]